ncbi:conserved Plasmodium protein, unknown function [Plasmodium gallinaceum]|uniref:Uncharacterized protein n=1 Tax=Plasmodium gallinaceum TaxID=5849 RepID=A0A1J1GQY6_PLAGA|nr:conserved Plasmodium protein, unknown function [Plasmodium gallinaceum]CRG94676.1 conserved Plasmodium protein, unknown function [Plasmodium gallinaceum]
MKSKKVNKLGGENFERGKTCRKNKILVNPHKNNREIKEKTVNEEIHHLSDYLKDEANEKSNENIYNELNKNIYDESNENVFEELNDNLSNFVFKKKIYEKNIAQIEKKIQTNKLNKLIETKEIILDMLTIIKNRKLNLS